MGKIITSFDHPPTYRGADWSAFRDGTEESGPVGRGATERAAVIDLLDQEDDEKEPV